MGVGESEGVGVGYGKLEGEGRRYIISEVTMYYINLHQGSRGSEGLPGRDGITVNFYRV